MERAYQAGLPRWSEIEALFNQYQEDDADPDQVEMAKAEAYAKICALRDFARYHFQSVSLYADHYSFDEQIYQSMSRDALGIAIDLKVTGRDGQLVVKDNAGVNHVIDGNDNTKIVNKMTRDYWFDSSRISATSIYTSSFCVVHELTEPLYVYSNSRFDGAWATRAAKVRTQKQYSQKKSQNKL